MGFRLQNNIAWPCHAQPKFKAVQRICQTNLRLVRGPHLNYLNKNHFFECKSILNKFGCFKNRPDRLLQNRHSHTVTHLPTPGRSGGQGLLPRQIALFEPLQPGHLCWREPSMCLANAMQRQTDGQQWHKVHYVSMCQISNMPPLLSESHQIVPKSRQGPSWARGPSGHNDSWSKYQPNRLSPVRISCPHPGQWLNRFRLGPLQLSSRFCIPSSDYAGQFCYLSIHIHPIIKRLKNVHVQSTFQLFIKMLIDIIWHWHSWHWHQLFSAKTLDE